MIDQPLSNQRIIECLITDYGIKVNRLFLLPLGADLNSSVYKAETLDQSSYFIKLKRGHQQDISAAIITWLHDAGIEHLITPIKSNHGKPIHCINDFTLIVFPFIEGKDGFSCDLTDDQWFTLGKIMRQVHSIRVPLSIQGLIRREDYSPKWREAVLSLYSHMKSARTCDNVALKLIAFMKKHSAAIHRLVNRAEQLSKQIQDNNELVLCHSDLHGGNVLIEGKDIFYIVDWDDPIMAPKERDLMFIGGGVANVWNKQHEEEFFYNGYGKVEINQTALAYYRHERIVEDIAILGQQLLLESMESEQNKIEAFQHFINQFDPEGVVEIAFKTDEYLKSS